MQRISLFLVFLSICFGNHTIAANDTLVHLDEVIIHGDRFNTFTSGNRTIEIDSSEIDLYNYSNIARLLNNRSSIFIKSYGPGMLATPSLRGSSASQTAIIWNGFNIQSPMHGQNDFSIIPVFISDKIEVQHGSTGAIWGSGAVGGAININNTPIFNGKISLESETDANSIENFNQQFLIKGSNKKIAATLRLFNKNANNSFNYYATGETDSVLTRKHAKLEQKGIMNELYYKSDLNYFINLRWWYQDNKRNIPPSLYQSHSGAYQDDETLRITTEIKKAFTKGVINSQFAFFDENIFFVDSAGIESLSKAKTWIQELDYKHVFNNNHNIVIGVNNNIVTAAADNYASDKSLQRIAAFSSWKWHNRKKSLHIFSSIRQEWQENTDIPFIPAAGFQYSFTKNLFVKGNSGKSFRMPSFNDLYWVPGGNPNLEPESGWNQDISFQYFKYFKNKDNNNFIDINKVNIEITGFHRIIDNWIIWLPQSGIWTPQNVMKVKSMGVETYLSLNFNIGVVNNNLKIFYDYISSENEKQKSPNDASVGKQLIYVPKHNARTVFSGNYKSLSIYYEHYYAGKRYTTSDNTEWLDAYQTANIGIRYTFPVKEIFITSGIDAINLWNESYMVVSSNPMPLRYFRATIKFRWDKNLFNNN